MAAFTFIPSRPDTIWDKEKMETTLLMDKIYRRQRWFYDLTRKYFLLGRDRLLDRLVAEDGSSVLEIGCGTGRNLALLKQKRPGLNLYGLDASHLMLKTARIKLHRENRNAVHLEQGLAETLDIKRTFDLTQPFDVILFSYALSMIPPWRKAVDSALKNLRTGGSLYIVDFWDQQHWPGLFRQILQQWLGLFHVRFQPELLDYLKSLDRQGCVKMKFEPVFGRYAFLAILEKIG
jgi:S-adenosylmethionine-diacylgycerolhomoserine-N-methlytransferase